MNGQVSTLVPVKPDSPWWLPARGLLVCLQSPEHVLLCDPSLLHPVKNVTCKFDCGVAKDRLINLDLNACDFWLAVFLV